MLSRLTTFSVVSPTLTVFGRRRNEDSEETGYPSRFTKSFFCGRGPDRPLWSTSAERSTRAKRGKPSPQKNGFIKRGRAVFRPLMLIPPGARLHWCLGTDNWWKGTRRMIKKKEKNVKVLKSWKRWRQRWTPWMHNWDPDDLTAAVPLLEADPQLLLQLRNLSQMVEFLHPGTRWDCPILPLPGVWSRLAWLHPLHQAGFLLEVWWLNAKGQGVLGPP